MLIIQNSPSSHQSPDAPIGRYIEAHRAAEGTYPCRGTLSMAHEKRRIEDADRWKRRLYGSHLATNPTALRLRARPRSRRARRAAHWASGAEASCACERRCGKTYTDVFIRAHAAARPPVRAQYARRYSPSEKPRYARSMFHLEAKCHTPLCLAHPTRLSEIIPWTKDPQWRRGVERNDLCTHGMRIWRGCYRRRGASVGHKVHSRRARDPITMIR